MTCHELTPQQHAELLEARQLLQLWLTAEKRVAESGGATNVSFDGQSVSYDLAEIQRRVAFWRKRVKQLDGRSPRHLPVSFS